MIASRQLVSDIDNEQVNTYYDNVNGKYEEDDPDLQPEEERVVKMCVEKDTRLNSPRVKHQETYIPKRVHKPQRR